MSRELPKWNFGSTEFYLDIRLNEFRQVDNFMNRISLDNLWETDAGYVAAFDTQTKNLFSGSEYEYHARLGKDVIEVRMPTLKEMDPHGFEKMLEGWKRDNPLMVRMIESIPIVVKEAIPINQALVKTHNLIEKKRERRDKGIRQ